MGICYNCFQEKKENTEVCPRCGYSSIQNRKDYPLALPNGTILAGQYILGRVLGQGGFGITYLAQNYKTKELVAIKEYFPDTLAMRNDSQTVYSYSGQREESFIYGKECFLNEAKTLAEFIGNPNIVRVYSYFEENNTAYFAMEYVNGTSFQSYINNNGGKIGFEAAKNILIPIMDALSIVHSKGIIHRDISPDNIFINSDGIVKLLDFGAARYSLGDQSRSLDVVLKHGFAPKEQYTRRGRQGPFTDVYSLAATFYRAITGRIPPDSIDRIDEDELILPSVLGVNIPVHAENALLKALAVQPSDRYRNMIEFKYDLCSQPQSVADTNNIQNSQSNVRQFNDTTVHTGNNPQRVIHFDAPISADNQVIQPTVPQAKAVAAPPTPRPVENIAGNFKKDSEPIREKEEKPKEEPKPIKEKAEKPKKEPKPIKVKEEKPKKEPKPIKVKEDKPKREPKPIKVKEDKPKKEPKPIKVKEEKPKKESKPIKVKAEKPKKEPKLIKVKDKNTGKNHTKHMIIGIASSVAIICIAVIFICFPSRNSDWEYSFNGDEVVVEKYSGNDVKIEIPDSIEGKKVTAIGNGAFYECTNITSVKIPNSVTLIDQWAFYGCSNLDSLSLPENCTIENYAFMGCDNLKSFDIPEHCEVKEYSFSQDVNKE
ncbi:MAG: leucine-rich repeat protein [Ruminococcus sp.]